MAAGIRDLMRRDEPAFTTQVRRGQRGIEVIPGESTLAAGRARKFIETLLAMGPFELEIAGNVIGEVRTAHDIYGDLPWEDPDLSEDPTESPPRTGALVTFYRDAGSDVAESLAFHDSGIVSYVQRRPIMDVAKTYRMLSPTRRAQLWDLIAKLPLLEEDGAGPNGEYLDPVYISLETPKGDDDSYVKLDAAKPSAEAAAFVKLVDGWAKAMRSDRNAIPPGMVGAEGVGGARVLRYVGNFVELGYDDFPDAPSLMTARGKRFRPNKSALIAYLQAGVTLVFAPGFERDVLDERSDAGSSSIATDGTYAWPRTLAYYVERYDVGLPEHFEEHVARNEWHVPDGIAIGSLRLPEPE
jgi:hypothetical protein